MTTNPAGSASPIKRTRAETSGTALQVPPRTDFVLLVSPSELEMVDGEALPILVRFPVDPGHMGVPSVKNPEEPIRWRGAVQLECDRFGRMLVDPAHYGLVPKVDGKAVKPASDEDSTDPRAWYVRAYPGHKGRVHVSLWQRPRILGSQVIWDVDKDGETDFRRQVVAKMFPGGKVDEHLARVVRLDAVRELARLKSAAKGPYNDSNAAIIERAIHGATKTPPTE